MNQYKNCQTSRFLKFSIFIKEKEQAGYICFPKTAKMSSHIMVNGDFATKYGVNSLPISAKCVSRTTECGHSQAEITLKKPSPSLPTTNKD